MFTLAHLHLAIANTHTHHLLTFYMYLPLIIHHVISIHIVLLNIKLVFKVHMKSKYLLLTLKTFQNDEERCFLFWNIFSHSRDIEVFVQKLMTSQTKHMNAINHKIENISENIGWVPFKLGSCYLHQVRHKIILSMPLSWQPFLLLGLFNTGLILSFIVVILYMFTLSKLIQRCTL